ncbi:MAG: hypothetical protein ACPGNT_06355, partial [Rhodospirillales bacterium]
MTTQNKQRDFAATGTGVTRRAAVRGMAGAMAVAAAGTVMLRITPAEATPEAAMEAIKKLVKAEPKEGKIELGLPE